MTLRRKPGQAATDAETVTRVREALEGYYVTAGAGAMVPVTHVLDLLNPRGMWSLDPQRRRVAGTQDTAPIVPPGPDADPVTGCRWAGPPGSAPPGS